jgi:hypothetical protein
VKRAWVVALLALAVAAAAGAQLRNGVEPGSYTALDGPQAGQDVSVGKSGSASILDRTSDLHAAPADDGCDSTHLVGTIEGKPGKLGGCGWGRLILLRDAPPLIRAIANAVTEEERAVSFIELGKLKPGGHQHWELALYGQLGVQHSLEALDAAEKAGDLSETAAGKIRRRLEPAQAIDEKMEKQMQTVANPSGAVKASEVRQLRNALSLKRDAFTNVVDELGVGQKKCTAEKEFDVFAVPDGYTGSNADVYPHGVPRNAKRITASFVDTATGKPPAAELFPGQTWTSEVKGFLPDGRLDVRVDVTGKGFGKPDANHKHWRVVVSYDC